MMPHALAGQENDRHDLLGKMPDKWVRSQRLGCRTSPVLLGGSLSLLAKQGVDLFALCGMCMGEAPS